MEQQQLTSEHLTLMIGSAIGAALFFIAVTAAIIFFFNRAERGDRAETEKFSEKNETAAPPDEDSSAN
jgi:hypothetical protein